MRLTALVVALTVIASATVPVAPVALGTTTTRAQVWCLLNLTGQLSISAAAARMVDELEFRVGPDCNVTTTRPSHLSGRPARPVMPVLFRGCQSTNNMETWVPGDVITQLTTNLEFTYDGANVQSVTRYQPSMFATGGYFLWSGPVQTGNITTPEWDIFVQHQEAFGYQDPGAGDSYNHTKSNEAHGHGDGNCNTVFGHWNFVCGYCVVRYYLSYY